jgi:putative salt-induced outer membrane protein
MRATGAGLCAVAILAAFVSVSAAQTNFVTVTNYVTVVVTNVVTITNVVTSGTSAVPVAATVLAGTPAVPKPGPKYPWTNTISAGLTMTRGNSHTLLYTGDYKADKKTPDNEFHLRLSGAYGSQNSEENVNNYGVTVQWNHMLTERFYGYIRTDAMRDVIADLDYRVNLGPGLGYYVMKQTNTSLAFEAGAAEQYEHLGADYETFSTFRLAEKFEHKLNDHARFWQNVEMLPQIDNFDNYVINFEAGIETVITKTFGLKVYLNDTYQKEPAAGRQKNDMKLVSGVFYKF